MDIHELAPIRGLVAQENEYLQDWNGINVTLNVLDSSRVAYVTSDPSKFPRDPLGLDKAKLDKDNKIAVGSIHLMSEGGGPKEVVQVTVRTDACHDTMAPTYVPVVPGMTQDQLKQQVVSVTKEMLQKCLGTVQPRRRDRLLGQIQGLVVEEQRLLGLSGGV